MKCIQTRLYYSTILSFDKMHLRIYHLHSLDSVRKEIQGGVVGYFKWRLSRMHDALQLLPLFLTILQQQFLPPYVAGVYALVVFFIAVFKSVYPWQPT